MMVAAPAAAELWRFEPLDTWFFRESRPMDSGGGAQLSSQFPPPVRTLVGAIRTTLGDALHVDWSAYRDDADHPLRRLIGTPDSPAPLSFEGPFLMKDGQRLYPAPLVTMRHEHEGRMTFTRLEPAATPVDSDLGRVRLPVMRQVLPGARPLEGFWMTAQAMAAVLRGQVPEKSGLLSQKDLFDTEPRLGIGLDERARRPIDGLLYQTRHLRLKPGISAGLVVRGLDASRWPQTLLGRQGLVRLGGEGRLAAWHRDAASALPEIVPKAGSRQLMVTLLSPARFDNGWCPDGFATVSADDGSMVWQGELTGLPARLVCAVTGKPVREGGWDLARQQSRDLQAAVPAGSCYFFEFDSAEQAREAARRIPGSSIGRDTAWGGGRMAAGLW
ncbi:type III-B CRISPR module-associated protein Cmr3 [Sphaerotilus uruguayifluvii]|uniref:CRISPR-associated protein Cmr3 n=1 Tax=Sphaerotilus uruguayifluvii TaxID=2735897 RepID=A0ABX2G9F4_9BURK|nr:type III-B CRISPR module-associated protein Cmr3 [Leptothrix sp. C29]NRT58055.1 CRISPR-associated protein Cmr3 [Leptothrix sp. C29]